MMFCALGHERFRILVMKLNFKGIEGGSPMEKTGTYDAMSQAI